MDEVEGFDDLYNVVACVNVSCPCGCSSFVDTLLIEYHGYAIFCSG